MQLSPNSSASLMKKQQIMTRLLEKKRKKELARSTGQLIAGTNKPDIPEAFADIWKPAPFKVYYGGRGKGASWSMVRALIYKAHTQKLFIVCGRETQKSIKESIHRLICNQIKLLGLTDQFNMQAEKIIGLASGSEIVFIGLAAMNIDNQRSLEGCDILYMTEAAKISAYTWETIVPTIRKDNSEIWVDFNPGDELDPTYQKFVANTPPTGSIVKQVHYYDNPFFPARLEQQRQDALARIEEAKKQANGDDTDPAVVQAILDYDHVWGGEPRKIGMAAIMRSRVVFDKFDTPPDARFFHGLDFGYAADPLAFIRCFIVEGIDERTGRPWQDLYIDREVYGPGIELDDIDKNLDLIPTARSWPIKADSSQPATISYLKRQGFNIKGAEKWSGSVEDGITHLKGFRRIVIHEKNCPNMVKEAKLYSFKVDRLTREILPIIVDKHNHGWDAVRYSLDGFIQKRGSTGVWAKLAQ